MPATWGVVDPRDTEMRDQLDVEESLTYTDVASQNTGATSQYFAHIFNNRPDPSFVSEYGLNPRSRKYRGNMVVNMRCVIANNREEGCE